MKKRVSPIVLAQPRCRLFFILCVLAREEWVFFIFAPESSDNSSMNSSNAPLNSPLLKHIAIASLMGLILLCVLWEAWLAPLKPGGSLLFLKALPLAFAVRGVAKGSVYTMQWSSMLVLLYLMEGVVRVMSDPQGPSILMAWLEILLSTVFFLSAIFYVRPAKRAFKARAKQASSQTSPPGS